MHLFMNLLVPIAVILELLQCGHGFLLTSPASSFVVQVELSSRGLLKNDDSANKALWSMTMNKDITNDDTTSSMTYMANGFATAMNRRLFGAAASASLLSMMAIPDVSLASEARTILMTGANSGLGKSAAASLVAAGHSVYLACRTEAKAKEAVAATGAKGGFECDLSSLASVREFVKTWGKEPIDALCLNAGVAPSTKGAPGRTKEGFELAVGTNHFGHFLLADGLFQCLEASSLAAPRLVVTASSVHDPDTPGGDVGSKATLGDLKGLEDYATKGYFDMVDGGEYDGDKAYKDSKLCNVFFTREANRRLQAKNSKVVVNCFSPGLITSTGLFRNQNPLFVAAFGFAATNLLKVAATVQQGGDTLVYMVDDEAAATDGAFYATEPGKPRSSFGPRTPSKEAQDTAKGQKLWKLSESLVGIKSSVI